MPVSAPPRPGKVAIDKLPGKLVDAIAHLASKSVDIQERVVDQLADCCQQFTFLLCYAYSGQFFPAYCGCDGSADIYQNELSR